MSVGLLFDATTCIGCGACSAACKEQNGLPLPIESTRTASTWTVVENVGGAECPQAVLALRHPTCVSVCPVAALRKTPEGPVVYDSDRCIGCRYCVQACPFGVPKYQWDRACPDRRQVHHVRRSGAGRSGHRLRLRLPHRRDAVRRARHARAQARARIAADPDRYVDHVYGLTRPAARPCSCCRVCRSSSSGLPTNVPLQPLPLLTWQVLSKIPSFVGVWGVFLFGIHWITKRRDEVSAYEAAEREQGR